METWVPEESPDTHRAPTLPGAPPVQAAPVLVRALGPWSGGLLTVGSIVGTGIFLTPRDVARALPDAASIVVMTIVVGLLTLAGALTYARLAVHFPRAGGPYVFLKEAYGPLWGFLYGWTTFLVIMGAGLAAIAMGFAEYCSAFVPLFAPDHTLASFSWGAWHWNLSGAALGATVAILTLTAINHVGLVAGARVQAALTIAEVAALLLFAAWALLHGGAAAVTPAGAGTQPAAAVRWSVAGAGAAMVALLWTYDGWYGLTFSAAEVRDPARNLPRGLVGGVLATTALYAVVMLAYTRVLPLPLLRDAPRTAEIAATALAGAAAGRAMTVLIMVCALGCLASNLVWAARAYVSMAEDGVFFRSLGAIHPVFRTPVRALWAQSLWAMLVAWTGTYTQLYTWVTVAGVLFHAATALAVLVLHRRGKLRLPLAAGVLAVVFASACTLLAVDAGRAHPFASLAGIVLILLGIPIMKWQRRHPGATAA